jgi:hypothetical protein
MGVCGKLSTESNKVSHSPPHLSKQPMQQTSTTSTQANQAKQYPFVCMLWNMLLQQKYAPAPQTVGQALAKASRIY